MSVLKSILFVVLGVSIGILGTYFLTDRHPDSHYELDYVYDVANDLNIARSIKNGECEELLRNIENNLETYSLNVLEFESHPDNETVLQGIKMYYEKESMQIPNTLADAFELLPAVNAANCYEIISVCGGVGCLASVTSLRPTSDSIVSYNGWKRSKGKCGRTKSGNKPCGTPLGLIPCV